MSMHVPEPLIRQFSRGDVDSDEAVRIAIHLDECPRCAAKAAAFEPLSFAFEAMDDPAMPDDLIEQVLLATQADTRRRLPALELAIGFALLSIATVMVVLGSDPIGVALRGLRSLPQLSAFISHASLSFPALFLAVALFVVGSSVALRATRRRST
ncbi:MAG: anti-sigma factor [Myxococcota bacterium]